MSSNIFRHIGNGAEPGKPERLFRAAICAFCCLQRPTRREVVQLDDLALPLFELVSAESRRFAAAALSECDPAPPALIRRLANEPVSVSAPLLVRSPLLTDVHLIGLIGRHGIDHARVIARRTKLNPAIRDLISALIAHSAPQRAAGSTVSTPEERSTTVPTPSSRAAAPGLAPEHAGKGAEDARQSLRAMMRPDATAPEPKRPLRGIATWSRQANAYEKLRSTALTGKPALFATALADVLEITLPQARGIVSGQSCSDLLTALRALDLTVEEAFVVAAAVFAGQFMHAEAIRLFVERFQALGRETARDRVRGWKADGLATHFHKATTPSGDPRPSALRAS